MNESGEVVVFTLDGQRFGLHLSAVERVAHAARVTSLPKAPEIVAGVINIHGDVLPIVDVRSRFGYPERGMELAARAKS